MIAKKKSVKGLENKFLEKSQKINKKTRKWTNRKAKKNRC